jgi:RNA polymerase sigma-70 factor (ECF subfamily)
MANEHDWLAGQFEENRAHLRAVAYRMLGSLSEADDAVQESWLRLSRADAGEIENMGGWLTTVVARVCLDMLRKRTARREDSLSAEEERAARPIASHDDGGDPEDQALLADAVGLALLVVLDTLNPAERLAFVLHDLFDMPFEEIAPIVGRTPTAARQLASRARRRVQRGPHTDAEDADLSGQRTIIDAFLAASRSGDFAGLLAALDPDVVLRADAAIVGTGAAPEVRGADAVARQFAGRAQAAQPALINGAVGLVWAPGGQPRVIFNFTIQGDKIVAIEMLGDPGRLEETTVLILGE